MSAQELCLKLLHADSEAEVVQILTEEGYWEDQSAWRDLGDQPENYPTVGGQQSRADQALVEKLVNSIDAKLVAAARSHGVNPEDAAKAPKTMAEARQQFFGDKLEDMDALAQGISVAATGARSPGRMSLTISDDGEGQTPFSMPKTILSVHKGSKGKIPFVQGKFHMGGTGVLEFCGLQHNVQMVLSKRQPSLLPSPLSDPAEGDWSFTIIRREDPTSDRPRSSTFTYLAPGPTDGEGKRGLLHFAADELPVFPNLNQAYSRSASWGTLFKLYEYGLRLKGNIILSDSLLEKIRLLLPEPALPIRFHECRTDFRGHTGCFDTTMKGLIATLDENRRSTKRDHVEWFDKFEINVDGEQFGVRLYLFKDSKSAANYRSDEGVVFTYNGQSHTVWTKDFFRRDSVKQGYLWQSLLAFVDCSALTPRAHERLFMTSREKQRDNEFKRGLERALEDKLRHHPKLTELAQERRAKERAEQPAASETFRKFFEDMIKRYPHLADLMGPGLKIANPHKPLSVVSDNKPWVGERFPTKFHVKNLAANEPLKRDAHLNSQVRITFETDAADDYFSREEQPGSFELFVRSGDELVAAKNWKSPSLHRGLAHVSLALPPEAEVGSVVTYVAITNDPSRIEPFTNELAFQVLEERKPVVPSPPSPTPGPRPPSSKPGAERNADSFLAIPEPIEVTEKDWAERDPPFDKMTGLMIKAAPSAGDGPTLYDYYVNMDNIFLQDAIKRKSKKSERYKNQFKLGMSMLAFSLVQQEYANKTKSSNSEDDGSAEAKWSIDDQVRLFTSAMAPFILPMVSALADLPEERETVLSSAGEAA